MRVTAKTNPSSWVESKSVAKYSLKRFNIASFSRLNSNVKHLVKLEKIHYHLIQALLVIL